MMTRMLRTKRQIGAVLAAIALSTTAAVALDVSPAQAADNCSEVKNKPNGEGYAIIYADVWMRTGPYGSCPIVRNVNVGQIVWIHCEYVNSYHNGWIWGRVDGTGSYGWLYINGDIDLVITDENGDGNTDYQWCSK